MLYAVSLITIAIGLTALIFFKKFKNQKNSQSDANDELVFLEIQVPRSEEMQTHVEMQTAPLAAENMFAALHGLLQAEPDLQENISFEIASGDFGIKFYAVVPTGIATFVENQIYAQYPSSHIKTVTDYMFDFTKSGTFGVADLHMAKSQIFPITTFRDFEVDPLSALTSALSDTRPGECVWFQVVVRPTADVWQKEGHAYVEKVRGGSLESPSLLAELPKAIFGEFVNLASTLFDKALGKEMVYSTVPMRSPALVRLSAGTELELKAIENKLSKMGFCTAVRIVSAAQTPQRVSAVLRSVVASLKQFSSANLNQFVPETKMDDAGLLESVTQRTFAVADSFVLTTDELASIFHLPSSAVETPNISWLHAKQSEPPANLPTKDCAFIGDTVYRNKLVRFGIRNTDDRLRHMYLIGKSGTGKSTLFHTLITQDIKNGAGVGVLDPHGELIDKILEYIPDDRVDDVIIIDPSDSEMPVGINLLEYGDKAQRNLMASALVSAVKVHFEYSWGPRLEYLLNNAILTLLEVEGTTMLGVVRLLSDMNYQKYILHHVKDPVILRFWEEEYKEMRTNQTLITQAVSPIQNKINRFLSSTTIRNILAQRKSTIDFYDAMNSGKIILMNLSKGKIGADNSDLLGALLVSRIQFMAMQRQNVPAEQRRPFYLYVDEFQNFTTGTFESILSESRKYGLGLYLTHQFTGQLPEELLKAVFGNVGTIATFALGAPDAKVLETEFFPTFGQNDMISLERFQIYIKLMVDGMTSQPFSARILLPWEEGTAVAAKTGNKERVIAASRNRYGTPREAVEERIGKWVERRFDKGMAIAEDYRRNGSVDPAVPFSG